MDRAVLILLAITVNYVTSERFFILPSSDLPCPGEFTGELCLSLDEYISGMDTFRSSNQVILQFLPGTHFMQSFVFSTSNIDSFEMVGEGTVTFICRSGTTIRITLVQNVQIRGISFNRCRVNIESVNSSLVVEGSNFINDQFGTQIDHPLKLTNIDNASIASTSLRDSNALLISASSVHFKTSTFSGNQLVRSRTPCLGAAIRVVASNITVEQSTFSGNRAVCSDGRFANNIGMGGAISADRTNLKVIGSTFTSNTVVQNGGAIHAQFGSIEVHNSTFMSNSATGGTFTAGLGAGLYVRNSMILINESTFIDNAAWAVYITGGSEVSVYGSIFMGNSAGGSGAALRITSVSSISVLDSIFSNNTGGSEGGALHIGGQNGIRFLLAESTFSDNSAPGCAALEIEQDNHLINFTMNTFTHNRIIEGRSRTGVICISDSVISITNSSFRHHMVPGHAGVFFTQRSAITIQDSDFYNNSAGVDGGALFIDGIRSSLEVHQSSFEKNVAQSGGALHVSGQGAINIHQCNFISNKALMVNGGALDFNGNNGLITIAKSEFIDNTASGGGGAIHIDGHTNSLLFTESTFRNNSASSCAVLQAQLSNRQINFTACNFTHNEVIGPMPTDMVGDVSGSGGVVCLSSDSISITDNSFVGNTATGHAGVLYVGGGVMSLHSSNFHNNWAGIDGGVMYSRNSPITVTVTETSFTNNHAGRDGGVFFVGRAGSQVDIENSILRFNSANRRGGTVAILGSVLNVNETIINSNIATLGEVASACNSDVTLPEGINATEDSTISVCTLYGNRCDVCTFPPTTSSPTTTEATTMPTISTTTPTNSTTVANTSSTTIISTSTTASTTNEPITERGDTTITTSTPATTSNEGAGTTITASTPTTTSNEGAGTTITASTPTTTSNEGAGTTITASTPTTTSTEGAGTTITASTPTTTSTEGASTTIANTTPAFTNTTTLHGVTTTTTPLTNTSTTIESTSSDADRETEDLSFITTTNDGMTNCRDKVHVMFYFALLMLFMGVV